MNRQQVGIVGGSGYAGRELAQLLLRHPGAELAFVASDRSVGTPVTAELGLAAPPSNLRFVTVEEGVAKAAGCAAVLLATPAEASLALVPRLLQLGCRVIDLSGAFRFSDGELFTRHYGLPAPSSALRSRAVYGLPELFRAQLAGATLIANPGCYATAAALALAPLLRAGLVDPRSLIVDAASGVTGAGRKASEEYSLAELEGDFRAYKVLRHQHTPEIAQSLSRVGGAPVRLTFTPHLLPVGRGILCTAYARLIQPATPGDLLAIFQAAYRDEPFIHLAAQPEQVSLRRVVGSNACQLGVTCEQEADGQVVVVAALDNLLKGAAGQAVQNLNLALGWEESAGLGSARSQLG